MMENCNVQYKYFWKRCEKELGLKQGAEVVLLFWTGLGEGRSWTLSLASAEWPWPPHHTPRGAFGLLRSQLWGAQGGSTSGIAWEPAFSSHLREHLPSSHGKVLSSAVARIHPSESHFQFLFNQQFQWLLGKSAQIFPTVGATLFLDCVNKNVYGTYRFQYLELTVVVLADSKLLCTQEETLSIETLFIEEIKACSGWPKSSCFFIMPFQCCCRDLLHVKWGLEHKRMTCQMGVAYFLLHIKELCNLPGAMVHRSSNSRATVHPQLVGFQEWGIAF